MTKLTISPAEGDSVSLGGMGVIFKVFGTQTDSAFSIVEHPLDPGLLTPPHFHMHEDELTYVVKGKIGARVGDQDVEASAGSYLFKPRGIPHAFWNAEPEPAHIIEIISPAGFEQYFAELAELFSRKADFSQMTELAKGYGLSYLMDWVPELTAKYHVRLLDHATSK